MPLGGALDWRRDVTKTTLTLSFRVEDRAAVCLSRGERSVVRRKGERQLVVSSRSSPCMPNSQFSSSDYDGSRGGIDKGELDLPEPLLSLREES